MSIKEVIQLIVFQYKMCSYDYMLDKMQMYELDFLLSSTNYCYRDQYEMLRFNAYVTAQTQSTKRLKPTDIISYSWDSTNNNNERNTSITNEDIVRLTEKASKLEAKFNNNNNS